MKMLRLDSSTRQLNPSWTNYLRGKLVGAGDGDGPGVGAEAVSLHRTAAGGVRMMPTKS